jgi:hypothetical protein
MVKPVGYPKLLSTGNGDSLEENNPNPNIILREETEQHNGAIKQLYYGVSTVKQILKTWPELADTSSSYVSIHEVIRGDRPQRIKFDIDAKIKDMPEHYDIDDIIHTVRLRIIDAFYELYYDTINQSIDYSDLIVANSNGEDKYSYHIILADYYAANNREAKYFAHYVINTLPPEFEKIMDRNVYGSIQSFRMYRAAKLNTQRVKKLDETYNVRQYSTKDNYLLIEAPKDKQINILPLLLDEEVKPINEVNNELVDAALKMAEPFTKGHEFTKRINNILCFKRLQPTYCRFCQETHSRDNSLLILILHNKVYEKCKQKAKKLMLIGELEACADETPVSRILQASANAHIFPSYNLPLHEYDEPSMRIYEVVNTLFVRAPMKIGKSKALKQYIESNFTDSKIRIISFRQTFSNAILTTLPEFELYNKCEGNALHRKRKLIIQVESLHRLGRAEDDIDLVVLDESESILEQFSSGLHGNFNASWATFEFMIKHAKHVVCMDANLENMTINTIINIRGSNSCLIHHNTFKNATSDKYWFTTSHNSWLAKLREYLMKNLKLVIPSNSLNEANSLLRCINTLYPNKNVRIYSSETRISIKNDHFSDVAKHWGELDVLIYTPTCSAGVSFELAHFDALFGYFTDTSCTVETCRQMLARVRILNLKEHYIFISGQVKFNPTDTNEIKQQLRNSRSALFQEHGGPIVPWKYGNYGEILFYESPYFLLWLETLRMRYLSNNNFIMRFINQVRSCGAEIFELPTMTLDDEFKMSFIGAKTENNLYYISKVAESENINDETAMEIYAKIEAQIDLEDNEKYSLEKYNLLSFYGLDKSKNITSEFVDIYNKTSTKEIFKNLLIFADQPSVDIALEVLKQKERTKYKIGREYVIDITSTHKSSCDYNDLNKSRYKYDKHYMAINLLKLCGLELFNLTPIITLYENIKANLPHILREQDRLEIEFDIRHVQLIDEKKALKFINGIIKKTYGISIEPNKIGLFDVHYLTWGKTNINFTVNGEFVAEFIPGAPTITTRITYEKINNFQLIDIFRNSSERLAIVD